jgi:lipoprotein-anchoring transpeptidase ErfK/SrfK
LVFTTAGLLLVAAAGNAAPASAGPRIAAEQDVVVLLTPHKVRATPSSSGRTLAVVSATRPITLERTTLPVLADSSDGRWARVRLPGRALGRTAPPRTGWISTSQTKRSSIGWHIVVNRGSRRVTLYRKGRRARTFAAIVGKPSTPTPRGEYFVEENVRLPGSASGAPFALATSARSSVYQEFEGGPGQIALHGIANIGGRMGTAASNGCIRMTGGSISWLAARIPAGTPVTIT